ncbi:N-acetylmuramoyl-L-alanine amidase [Pasteurellaceae bacterium TAE3-ERU1]|nr:N-acetylmuramoyl-L-alanine amidase [Pasteurellaceae bacterium TAE3-ERU1]
MSTLARVWTALALIFLFCVSAFAGTLTNVKLSENNASTEVRFAFSLPSKFSYFPLHNPERLVIDFQNSQLDNKSLLPVRGNGAVKKVRTSQSPRSTTLRVVLELEGKSAVKFAQKGKTVTVTVPKTAGAKSTSAVNTAKQVSQSKPVTKAAPVPPPARRSGVLTIAIDAGHGGKDPGATGANLQVREKNVTLQIAKELKAMLDADPRFRSVLTRRGDYYISVPERSEIARKNKANYLISIHADSNMKASFQGASVWVLSNKRANSEMGRWLEDHEKQSELLGGAGNVLASHDEKYLNQTVLDLQFGHSQRAGYQLGQSILRRIGRVASLSKNRPQHASLGVLRSPDIPSVLVETGFLSNAREEQLLSTTAHRRKIANAIYQGLIDYYNTSGEAANYKSAVPASSSKSAASGDVPSVHVVKSGESLGLISIKYNIKLRELRRLNGLKDDNVRVGQKIKLK